MSKKRKKYEDDDGHTVINMNVEGMRGYEKPQHTRNREEIQKLNLSKKERRAIFWGSFLAIIPGAIITALCFGGAILAVYFWLR